MPGPASLHHGVHPPLPWPGEAGDGLATTPPSFWGEGEAGEGWAMSGETRAQLFGDPGRTLPGVTHSSVARHTGSHVAPLPGHHLPLSLLLWLFHRHLDPVSLLPPAQGPGDSVTPDHAYRKKAEPPGDSSG